MASPASERTLVFDDPRLQMTIGGRFLVRVVSYVGYFFTAGLAFTFIISGAPGLRAWGALCALFLGDLLIHFYDADASLSALPRQGEVNVAQYMSKRSFAALERAYDRSSMVKHPVLLEAAGELSGFPEVREGISRLDIPFHDFKDKLDSLLKDAQGADEARGEKRGKLAELGLEAAGRALAAGHVFIEPGDIFAALPSLRGDERLLRLFGTFAVEADDLASAMLMGSILQKARHWRSPVSLGGFMTEVQRGLRHRIMNRAWTARPTPTLDRYGRDFTDLARAHLAGFLVGHDEEVERLLDTVARPANPNALLVGEAGVGKETLVAHLAFRLIRDDVPAALFDRRLVELDIAELVAGAAPEELQARLQKIIREIDRAGNVILYIPDIHNLLKTSGSAFLSAADALIPIIMDNDFPVIGTTYPREFKSLIEPRSDFTGVFEVIRVGELSEADAEKVLIYESVILERKFKVQVSFGAIRASVRLAKKYLHDKFLPTSASELLKSALTQAASDREKTLDARSITRAAEAKTHIPIHEASGAEAEALLHLEDTIHRRFIDQEEAVKSVANALREYRSGLSRKGGPIATFLFVGPTGVGKTELAKILAKVQFGAENAMTRFDMTEYQDKQSFYRFIGAPDGSISGALTEAIKAKPYSLILLDEFEKAYPDILNLFLQVFDDGRLTDNLGNTVDFTNTIIIATSNAHSDIVNDSLEQGETMAGIADYLKRKLTDVFRPELLNRFSRIVVFKNLEPEELRGIVELRLGDFAESAAAQGMALVFDDSAVKQISKLGYDPAFGARPIRRAIEENLEAPFAEKILRKEAARGAKIKVSFDGAAFRFTPEA